MKVKITESELQNLIRNEVRKIVGEDSLMAPPELGEPNYLELDGPAVPADRISMGPDDSEICPVCGRKVIALAPPSSHGMSASSGCGPISEGSSGCGCGTSSDMESHPVDRMVSDILVNPRALPDMSHPHKGASYMARPQLTKIAKYASKLLSMIDEGEQIQDWQESKISQMSQMIGDVYHSIEYKKHKGEF